jgi:hypothetical protein
MGTLTKRRVADQDIADEVESYLAQAAEDLEASGMSPDEARRTVRVHCVFSVRSHLIGVFPAY